MRYKKKKLPKKRMFLKNLYLFTLKDITLKVRISKKLKIAVLIYTTLNCNKLMEFNLST